MAAFDWPVLMRAGIQGLGLQPAEFWALTPTELALMLGPGAGQDAMSRSGFEQLMQTYPDHQEDNVHG